MLLILCIANYPSISLSSDAGWDKGKFLSFRSCREEITLEISDLEAGGQEAGGQEAGGQEAGGQEAGGQEAGGQDVGDLEVKWRGTTEAGRRITRRGVKARCSA
jgi:hypothetical protein